MKKGIKRITFILLTALIAAIVGVVFSACGKTGGDNVEKDAGSGGAVDESKWNVSDGLAVGFFSDTDCPQGDIDESKSKRELNSKLNERQYMVADFTIQAPRDNDGKESVTAEVKISPASAASATVQETNTGNVTEETADDTTTIKAVYKIPDKAEAERKIRLVIRIDAIDRSLAEIDLKLNCPEDMPAVSAKSFEKQAVMGYTEELEYEGSAVKGITDKSVGKAVIPTEHGGVLIDTIGDGAFKDCGELTDIILPEGVTGIGDNAFYKCGKLASIVLPDGTTDIGTYAFHECIKLTSITMPDSVTNIGIWAFAYCSGLESITIPDGVTNLGVDIFYGCSKLKSVELGDGVASIDDGAFENCNGLEGLTVSEGNLTYASQDGVLYNKEKTQFMYVPASIKGSVTIAENVSEVGEGVFLDRVGLTGITVPKSVTSINVKAFDGCTGLESVNVESGNAEYKSEGNCLLSADGGTLVFGCKTSVIPDGVTLIGEGAFRGCTTLTDITIPNGVTGIGKEAFLNCEGLTSVTLPDGLTTIDYYAFRGCSNLTTIKIPNSIIEISYAFYECPIENATLPIKAIGSISGSKLETVVLTDGDSIPRGAFSGYSKLTNLTIPSCVKSIDATAFKGCVNLVNVVVDGENTVYKSEHNCLLSKDGKTLIAGYKNSEIPNGVTNIGDNAFSACSELKNIIIPSSVTDIGNRAFGDCRELTGITIPSSVATIGHSAFEECRKLTSITFPSSVTSLGNSLFYGCDALEKIVVESGNAKYKSEKNCILSKDGKTLFAGCKTSVIPSSVTEIGVAAFSGCRTLTGITIPNGVEGIGGSAFKDCAGLTSITVPSSVKIIGDAFVGCTGLTSITLPFVGNPGTNATCFGYIFGATHYDQNSRYVPRSLKTVIITGGTKIAEGAFFGCSGLESVTIPEGVTSIEKQAFYGCSGLKSLNLPNIVALIDNYAFDGCGGFEKITVGSKNTAFKSEGNCLMTKDGKGLRVGCKNSVIPNGVIAIYDGAFGCCRDLTSLTIPKSVTNIGVMAFYNCSGLRDITYKGTIEQWCAVKKGDSWLFGVGGKVTVHCTDGDLTHYGSVN